MLKCQYQSTTSRQRPCGKRATYMLLEGPKMFLCENCAKHFDKSKLKKIRS